jgi:hypothetical protein
VYNICAQGWITPSTSTLPSGTIDHESVNHIFDELGPIARLCIDYLVSDDLIEQYRKDVQVAISNVTTVEELERLFQNSRSLAMDAVSHKICLISRRDKEDLYSGAIVSPVTPYIASRLANRLRSLLELGELIRLYKASLLGSWFEGDVRYLPSLNESHE